MQLNVASLCVMFFLFIYLSVILISAESFSPAVLNIVFLSADLFVLLFVTVFMNHREPLEKSA